MNTSFTLTKLDEINLKKYNLSLKELKKDIKDILAVFLSLDEIKTKKIFNDKISKIRFDVSLCDDKTIKEINRQYRDKDRATDVITFSLYMDDDNSTIYRKTADLGQIIVSVETADKQKDENKNTLKQEILTLITHGILHLFGFDHLTKKDYDFVIKVQKKVVEKYEQISIKVI